MPGHNNTHFTGKTRPAIKHKTRKKKPKMQKTHENKYRPVKVGRKER